MPLDPQAALAMISDLDTKTAALEHALNPSAREQERAELMKEYGPTGKWRFAPKDAREDAAKEIAHTQDVRAGHAMYVVGKLAIDIEPELQRAIADAEELPSAITAWSIAHGKGGNYNLDEELAVLQLEEQRIFRFDRHYEQAPPSVVLAAYEKALETNDDAFQRWVEMRHGTQWTGVRWGDLASNDPKEATAVQRLRRRIRATRQARVPEAFHKLRATVANTNKTLERLKDAHGAVPMNPDIPIDARAGRR